MQASFSTYGDLGDIIYLCPTMRLVAVESATPVTLYCKDGLRDHDPLTARIPLFKGLLEAQDYIEAVLPWNEQATIDYDTCLWREIGYPYGVTLATLQAAWLRLNPDLRTPWLDVSAASNYAGKIIINRSPRYHNDFFPWAKLVKAFGSRMLFIGLESEHEVFCHECGQVAYLPTTNLLRAARVIAGSELFIGNQSSLLRDRGGPEARLHSGGEPRNPRLHLPPGERHLLPRRGAGLLLWRTAFPEQEPLSAPCSPERDSAHGLEGHDRGAQRELLCLPLGGAGNHRQAEKTRSSRSQEPA